MEKKRRRELAAKQRENAVQSIASMQSAFIKKHKFAVSKDSSVSSNYDPSSHSAPASGSIQITQVPSKTRDEFRSCFAVNSGQNFSSWRENTAPEQLQCILCKGDEADGSSSRDNLFVYAAFAQNSSLFSKSHMRASDHENKTDDHFLYPPADVFRGVYCNTCGHAMHYKCWLKYVDFLRLNDSRRLLVNRLNSFFNVESSEYPCPLCKRLSNGILAASTRRLEFTPLLDGRSYEDWLGAVRSELDGVREGQLGGAWLTPKPTPCHEQPAAASTAPAEPTLWAILPANALLADLSEQINHVFRLCGSQNPGDVENSDTTEEPKSECLTTFANFVYTNGLRLNHSEAEQSALVLLCCWSTVAFTLRSTEAILTFDRKPLFGAFSSREQNGLRCLVDSTALYTALCNPKLVSMQFARLLAPLVDFLCLSDPNFMPLCVLDFDAFCLLVELVFASTDRNFDGVGMDNLTEMQHLFKLCFSVFLLQLLCSVAQQSQDHQSDSPTEPAASTRGKFAQFCVKICDKIGLSAEIFQRRSTLDQMVDGLKHFLRLSALFFNFLLRVDPPEALSDLNIDEFVPLCRYLNVPTSLNELSQFIDANLIDRWILHPRFLHVISTGNFTRQPVLANLLIDLPENYCDLINKTSKFKCPSLVNDDSRNPAICLACGCILCSQAYCCQITIEGHQQIGACTNHARFCTCDKGLFLRIRDCRVMLTYQQTRGCHLPAPYVDEYGETDCGFKRGNPLHLNEEMVRKLKTIWFHQTVPDTVASQLERNSGGPLHVNFIEWQHL